MPDVATWSTWGAPLAWTLVTLAVSWGYPFPRAGVSGSLPS